MYYSNCTYAQLHPAMSLMIECCDYPQRHHAAIFDKYTDKRFKRASHFVENELNKGFVLPHAYCDNLLVRYRKDGTPVSRVF